MTCSDWEARIALYSGGDLAFEEGAEVERHLAGCAGCREFRQGLEETLALMRAVHAGPLASADYSAVRAGVLERIDRRRRHAWALVWAGGLAAAMALGLLFFVPRPRPVEPLQFALTPPAASPPVRTEMPAPRRRRVRRTHPGPAIAPASEPFVVKLVTDDPDVVIYWIVDDKGD